MPTSGLAFSVLSLPLRMQFLNLLSHGVQLPAESVQMVTPFQPPEIKA